MPAALVIAASLAYLGVLFAVAAWADGRARQGRSVIANGWVYAASIAVYCTAWTYFGSVGRAASSGVWFLPIYLGAMLAMMLAWTVLRRMVRIAHTYRLTSIADFIASRYGKSRAIAVLVTSISVVGIVPYIALQLKAVAIGYTLLVDAGGAGPGRAWWQDSALYAALALAGFTIAFGTRHLDSTERHEGMVAAIALESIVKLLAFLAVGVFVVWGLFDGLSDLFTRAAAVPSLHRLFRVDAGAAPGGAAAAQWFGLMLVSMLSLLLLPRQFQVMVVENVDEQHLKRAAWAFPLYLLLINLFVLPIAFGGLLYFGVGSVDPETFVVSLPLAAGVPWLALIAFVGGLSAATGMVIVESIAVSTMVSNDLVLPLVWRARGGTAAAGRGDVTRQLLVVRRATIVGLLLLGYLYYRLAGEAYALVSIGLISFAAVAQFAPALLVGMYWKGATRAGALAGLGTGFALWIYTLLLPAIIRSGWLPTSLLEAGPWGITLLRPQQLLGLTGLDGLTHSLFWSLLANAAAFFIVSLARAPGGDEASQAVLFVDVFDRARASRPVFWRGTAKAADLHALTERFIGAQRARRLFEAHAQRIGAADIEQMPVDGALVQAVETQLAGAIGSASARVMVASVAQEEALGLDDVLDILDEASQVRAYSAALEEKSRSLERATAELREANQQLKSLDRLKDDFVSSVSHELRTPLTAIRAMAELMQDDDGSMGLDERHHFLGIIVSEAERLSRLVNQVLDVAKLESGHFEWHFEPLDVRALLEQAQASVGELVRGRGAVLELQLPQGEQAKVEIVGDHDRLLQVLINLLSNAAKFVPQDGGRIALRLATQPHGVTIEVQDNGPGIAAAEQAQVFEKFRQAGDTAQRTGGTGLGLPISRQIVEHHGGRMRLCSTPGAGATFVVELPWRPPAASPDAAARADAAHSGAGTPGDAA